VDGEVTRAALACARSAVGADTGVADTVVLRDRPGGSVLRVMLMTAAGRRSVIVKEARARERTALEVLTQAGVPGVPRLLAASEQPALVVMADAGDGPSVADRLMGQDPDAAAQAVTRWAAAVARLQAATLGLGQVFSDRLAGFGAAAVQFEPPDRYRHRFGLERAVSWKFAVTHPDSAEVIAETFAGLRDGLAPLGLRAGPDVLAELGAITERLRADPACECGPGALTPCDTCPDNEVDAADGLVLLDFEGAQFRHIAWDAAYLTVPWPSCWCSWRLPGPVADAALRDWRAVIEPAVSPETAASLDAAVADATVAWVLITTAWFLDAGHADTPLGLGGSLRPGARELIQHRLGLAAATGRDSVLGEFAARALDATRTAWGDQPLAFAPAWR
jgi:hypothetical protein